MKVATASSPRASSQATRASSGVVSHPGQVKASSASTSSRQPRTPWRALSSLIQRMPAPEAWKLSWVRYRITSSWAAR